MVKVILPAVGQFEDENIFWLKKEIERTLTESKRGGVIIKAASQ